MPQETEFVAPPNWINLSLLDSPIHFDDWFARKFESIFVDFVCWTRANCRKHPHLPLDAEGLANQSIFEWYTCVLRIFFSKTSFHGDCKSPQELILIARAIVYRRVLDDARRAYRRHERSTSIDSCDLVDRRHDLHLDLENRECVEGIQSKLRGFESKVFEFMIKGLSIREISCELQISQQMVRRYRTKFRRLVFGGNVN
jgi:hypothetical protein